MVQRLGEGAMRCVDLPVLTKSENSLGPLYALATFATFLGVIIFALAVIRARSCRGRSAHS